MKRVSIPQIPNDAEEILKAFRAAITAKTRILSFTDVSKHGVAGAATGGVRFCPHVYNTLEEIDRAVSALYQVAKDVV